MYRLVVFRSLKNMATSLTHPMNECIQKRHERTPRTNEWMHIWMDGWMMVQPDCGSGPENAFGRAISDAHCELLIMMESW
jgi:hypothetical protein